MKDVTYVSLGLLTARFRTASTDIIDEAFETLNAFEASIPRKPATLPHSALTALAERLITQQIKALESLKETSASAVNRMNAELALSLVKQPYHHDKYDINAWNAAMAAVEEALAAKYPHLTFEKPPVPALAAATASPTDLS